MVDSAPMSSRTARRIMFLLIAILCFGQNISAATWYAAPAATGAGNGTTPADRDTIFNILSGFYPLAPGDSIDMASGTYVIVGSLIAYTPLHIYGTGTGTLLLNGNPTFQFPPASNGSSLSNLHIDQSLTNGLTITNSQVDIQNVSITQAAGNGIYITGAAATGGLNNSFLVGNQDGIISNNSGLSYITNTTIRNNVGWGVLFAQNGACTIDASTFRKNGIAVEMQGTGHSVDIKYSRFVENGSGVLINNAGSPGNNTIFGNDFQRTANIAVGVNASNDQTVVDANFFFRDGMAVRLGPFANTRVTNNIIRDTIGTAIYTDQAGAGIFYNTIAWAWEGIHATNMDTSLVENNIVYQCTATGIWADGFPMNGSCNDSWGNGLNYSGVFLGVNASVDPMFTFGSPFFQLAAASPLIGGACNTWISTDYYGNPRNPFPNTEPGAVEN